MTRENANKWLKDMLKNMDLPQEQYQIALEMAIKALQEPCEDCINRDMALEKMADYVSSGYADSAEDFEAYSKIICELPSVKPQEPCDVISRQATLKPYEGLKDDDVISVWLVKKNIEQQEPVNPRIEYGTDGNPYKLSISNGKEYEQEPKTETITEFADRCKECGAKYGRLLQQEPKTDLNKIRAEIEATPTEIWEEDKMTYILAGYFKKQVLKIIDKYRQEG